MNPAGQAAEDTAARWLQQQGLSLVERNYRARFGEIDLIMREGSVLVFVEVRLRKNNDFGGAAASITPAKQQKLIRTAESYLAEHGSHACRFDALLLTASAPENITWLKNAFEAT